MRKFLLACSIAASALGVSTAANAQDWNGAYGGFDIGYGFSSSDHDATMLPSEGAFGAQNFSSSVDTDGAVVGVHLGYNWQHGNWVVGLEADVAWANMEGEDRKSPLNNSGGVPQATWFHETDAGVNGIGTARVRVGKLIQPNTLVYATGGLAYGEVEFDTYTGFSPGAQFQYVATESEKQMGWTLGGGVEWQTTGNWSFRGEYLYYDIGESEFEAFPQAPNAPFRVRQDFSTTGSLIRVGASYNF